MSNLINHMSTLYSTNIVAGIFVTIFGVLLAYYMVYYVFHMIALFVMTMSSGIRMLPEISGARQVATSAAYDIPLDQANIGFTMPDGGEPVSENEEEKES